MLRLLLELSARRAKGRALLAVIGIALGVALGYGVYLVNRAAVGDLAAAVRQVAGEADLEVRATRSGFSESLYPRIARVPGVASVLPRLELEAGMPGTERTIRVIGVDVLREGGLRLPIGKAERLALLETGGALLSSAAAQALGVGQGGRLRLLVGQSVVGLKVVGIVPITGFAAVTDIATAQWRLERLGELNRLDVRVAPGAGREAVRARIAALLPAGAHVSTVEQLEQASGYPSRAYRVNLDVLAMVALFTGGFLVFSAQTLEAARRRGEHALLRTLGLRSGDVARLVLLEAGAAGVLGSALGIALGYALARGALASFGADLGAGEFRALFPRVDFSPWAAAGYFGAGIAVSLLGALVPAMDAARAAPARALKAGDEQAMFARVSPAWPGAALLLAGLALAQLGPVRGLPLFGYASIACLLLGAIALMPRVSQIVYRALPGSRSIPLTLALAQLRGAPGQAGVSLAAIVASFSLMVAMAIMVTSFRESVARWLDAVLPADLYLHTSFAGDTGHLEPGFRARLRGLPGVARVEFLRTGRILLDVSRTPVALIARDHAAGAYPLVGEAHEPRPGEPPPVWASEAVADIYGWRVGQVVRLPLGGRERPFTVAGVFRDYARQHGSILLERSDYAALTGDRTVDDAALWLAPGASAAAAMRTIAALPGSAEVKLAEPGEIRRRSLAIFDRSFAVTYAMEAVAVLVGLFGLSSSLGAIVLSRRRELGVLRHLGVTRGQLAAMLAAEGGLLAMLGALAGLAAGAAISLVLVYVVNRQSFNWSMELHFPWLPLAGFSLLLIALAVLTAYFSASQATGIGPVRAVREDW